MIEFNNNGDYKYKPIDNLYIKNNLIHKSIYNMILNRIKNKISYDDLLE